MTPALANICDDPEITVACRTGTAGNGRRSKRAPKRTCAEQAMERILKHHGAGHLTIVLKSIVETENNGTELVAPVICTVSDIILAYRAARRV